MVLLRASPLKVGGGEEGREEYSPLGSKKSCSHPWLEEGRIIMSPWPDSLEDGIQLRESQFNNEKSISLTGMFKTVPFDDIFRLGFVEPCPIGYGLLVTCVLNPPTSNRIRLRHVFSDVMGLSIPASRVVFLERPVSLSLV